MVVVLAQELHEPHGPDYDLHRYLDVFVLLGLAVVDVLLLPCVGIDLFVVHQHGFLQKGSDFTHFEFRDDVEVGFDDRDQYFEELGFAGRLELVAKPGLDVFVAGLQQCDGQLDALVADGGVVVIQEDFEDHFTRAHFLQFVLLVVDRFVEFAVRRVPVEDVFVGLGLVSVFDDPPQQVE